jgi:hypothetical protein
MAHVDYAWAFNKVKLQQSVEALKKAGIAKPSEEEVKEEYTKRKGKVVEDEADAEPKSLEDLSPKELKALAEEKEVDLEGATKKADIIAKLEEAGITL